MRLTNIDIYIFGNYCLRVYAKNAIEDNYAECSFLADEIIHREIELSKMCCRLIVFVRSYILCHYGIIATIIFFAK